ncbi:Plant intracellular ras-group-related lrr protein [Thalictrum thalictroides]|uniref:Plant intracellular ras-group-related lrr protein n=1 Tax=Thalictrum thalictroides TaxID=46969 RepID=A0A7J6X4H3_THATH|nr:Plant intracellular ras-group-related lrr protein [Thalictrum thalictroides]
MGYELANLHKLSVNSNKLVFLPFSISHLTNLRVLDARLNCLRSLPEGLENLINLEILNVSQNFHYLDTLPYSIGLLISLVELDISYNKIKILPDSMGCLKKLQKLSVEGNPLVTPPMDIIEQGIVAVKVYLSDNMNKSPKSPSKKAAWMGKLGRWKTFNGRFMNSSSEDKQDPFDMSYCRPINGLASPSSSGKFSPRRLFSARTYISR